MSEDAVLRMLGCMAGFLLWLVILYPMLSGKGRKVSGNKRGKMWEQDELLPELFDGKDDDL